MPGEEVEPIQADDAERLVAFLRDLPLDGSADVETQFGHSGVAETLRTIVKRCPTPFTIALYGSWGTGKSSIVGLLGSLLKTERIPTVVVDVWKYQDDSLRRTVLKELHRQGCLKHQEFYDQDTTLDERVEQETSLATEFKLGIELSDVKKNPKLWRRTKWELGVAAAVLVGVLLAVLRYPLQVGPVVAAVFAGVLAVLATLKATAVLLTPKTRTWTQGKYADPYEFEDEFLRLLRDGYRHATKVLIVFDNLDRVDDERAIEVLTTIKTFLETVERGKKSKAVFLVPCDDRAIREQVEKRFRDGDEFLRKFFNVSLRLPQFFGTELQDYTLELLRETNVPSLNNPRIAWMVAKTFRSNPRQVKQFVNVLVAEYLLAHRRSETAELPANFAEDSVLELTLFQLLQTRFPRQLSVLTERGQRSLRPKDLHGLPGEQPESMKELVAFLTAVAHYAQIRDLQSWLNLRRTKHEAELPGVDDFLSNLEFAEVEAAAAFINDHAFAEDASHNISLAIQERADRLRTSTAIAEFFDTVLRAVSQSHPIIETTTMDALVSRAANTLPDTTAQTALRMDPALLTEELAMRPESRARFVEVWAKLLKDFGGQKSELNVIPRSWLVSLVRVLSEHPDWFAKHADEVRAGLRDAAGRDTQLMRILAEGEGAEAWIEPALAFAFADALSVLDEDPDFEQDAA